MDYYATSSDLRRHLMNQTNALYAYAWIGRRKILQATSFDLRRQRVTLIYHFVTSTLLVLVTQLTHCCVAIDRTMPKKTRPITVLTAEELDALDDATFAELAADEERLHQALEDPSSIRSGQALSIAKTKPRRQTVARQPIILPSPR